MVSTVLFAPTTRPEPQALVPEMYTEVRADENPVAETSTSTESLIGAVETADIVEKETTRASTTEKITLFPFPAEFSGQAAVAAAPPLQFPTEGVFAPINERTRLAVVNIVCQRREGRKIHTTTGSGVIIDPRGIVLTNAHVADLFLLEGERKAGNPVCNIRTGNPAVVSYSAELLFIPRHWVEAFAPDPADPEPRGTGEEDFALLRITEPTLAQTERSTTTFPFIPFDTARGAVRAKDPVLVGGYPALAPSVSAIRSNLYLVSTLSTITELFTLDGKNMDLITVAGNIASAQGSSGGAVVNAEGNLVGIVVASSRALLSLERELRALSLNHISRRIEVQTGKTLEAFLAEDIEIIATEFNENDLPLLKKKLLSDF